MKIDERIRNEIVRRDRLQLWATKTMYERVALIN